MDGDRDELLTAAMAAVGQWAHEFRTLAHQLNAYRIAGRWYRLGVTAAEAADWANLGYLPEDAAPLITADITPATVREMERYAEETAGGRDELVARRIRQMVEAGEIVDPTLIARIPDPTDPACEIVAILEDPDWMP